jgi:hypothetical protein
VGRIGEGSGGGREELQWPAGGEEEVWRSSAAPWRGAAWIRGSSAAARQRGGAGRARHRAQRGGGGWAVRDGARRLWGGRKGERKLAALLPNWNVRKPQP